VLAAAEPLLLGRGDDPPVHDQRGRRIVEDRVDPEETHRRPLRCAGVPGVVAEESPSKPAFADGWLN